MDKTILVYMLPDFNKYGYLPPGRPYKTTWSEFSRRFGFNEHREKLLLGLKAALDNLKQAGCRKVYINGSFVTAKLRPGDWDACWDMDGVNSALLDLSIIDADFKPNAVKAKYFGDLFLQAPRLPGRNFVTFFQRDRDGNKKGIVIIDLGTLP